LRGRRRKAAADALAELRDRGCEAAGYRLSGAVLDHVCCRHLYGADRLLTVWHAEDHATVIAVGPHDQTSGDVYAALLEALDLDMNDEERRKPPCCDDEGQPPSDQDVAEVISDAIDRAAVGTRRGRR
jgi:hypothetical protein